MIDTNKDITYEDIIETAGEISQSERIAKGGLTLLYQLNPDRHKDLDEHLFYKTNQDPGAEFEHKDIIRIQIADVKFMFVRDDKEITFEDKEEEETYERKQ